MSKELDPRPIYYCYCLFDWMGIPRYIGKGKGERWNGHITTSDPSNWLKNEFIEQTWIMLEEIPKIIIKDKLSEKEAYETEVAFIKAIGRIDQGTGTLTNMTDGGPGMPGFPRRPLTLEKQANHRAGAIRWQQQRTPEERRVSALKGAASMTPEQRRIRYLNWRASLTPEQIFDFGRNLTKNMTPEERRRISSLGGKAHTFEQLSAMGRKGGKALTHEEKSKATKKGWATQTIEQRHARAMLMVSGQSKNKRWITNGFRSKLLRQDEEFPKGWKYGRAPFKSISKEPVQEPPTEC